MEQISYPKIPENPIPENPIPENPIPENPGDNAMFERALKNTIVSKVKFDLLNKVSPETIDGSIRRTLTKILTETKDFSKMTLVEAAKDHINTLLKKGPDAAAAASNASANMKASAANMKASATNMKASATNAFSGLFNRNKEKPSSVGGNKHNNFKSRRKLHRKSRRKLHRKSRRK